jgi:hypothetical protein
VNSTWGFGISYKKIVSTRGYVKSDDKQIIKMITFMFAKWSYSRVWIKEYKLFYDQAEHYWDPSEGAE